MGFAIQLVDVWVKYAVDEANTRALVWVLIGKLDMNLPKASGKWSYPGGPLAGTKQMLGELHTFIWSLESNIELLP